MNLMTLAERLQGVQFNIHLPDGRTLHLGQTGVALDWHVHSEAALRRILEHPQLQLGRTYLDGRWDVDTRHLPVLLEALIPATAPTGRRQHRILRRLRTLLPAVRRRASPPRWQDTNLWLSRICLGDELFQGCAHYSEPGISLEQAQRTRCRDLIERLQIKPGQHLLDINAGWGALPLYLAEHADTRVTALVATREQLQYAHNEARRRGLGTAVHFRLGGFRQCQGRFDRIFGSGLALDYPPSALRAQFERLAGLLCDDGMLWLQLGARHGGSLGNRWYLRELPRHAGGPALSALYRAIESSRLRTLQLEDLCAFRLQDLRTRAQRYHLKRVAISRRFGEQSTRYWEFMLASEICALAQGQLVHYELVLGNPGAHWPVPGTRSAGESPLPMEIVRAIPGLAGDI